MVELLEDGGVMESFANIFKQNRQQKSIGFVTLSKKIGVVPSVLHKYEIGEIFPKEAPLKKICSFFDLDFNIISKLVAKEKKQKIQKRQTARIYGTALYPEMRKILLDSYCIDYAITSGKTISKNGMIKEFRLSPLHPIEGKLIEITNNRLHAAKLIDSQKSIISDLLPSEQKKDLFKKVITDWGYIPSSQQLLITIEKNKGRLDTICYKMKIFWSKEKQGNKD